MAQRVEIEALVLGPAGGEGGDLGGLGGVSAAARQLRLDLGAAAREGAQGLVGDAGHLGRPAMDLAEVKAELVRELGSELGLVEVAGGLRPTVEALAVERAPAAVLRSDQVGDQHVGVKLRVAGPAHPMAKGRGDKAPPSGGNEAVGAEPRVGGL